MPPKEQSYFSFWFKALPPHRTLVSTPDLCYNLSNIRIVQLAEVRKKCYMARPSKALGTFVLDLTSM